MTTSELPVYPPNDSYTTNGLFYRLAVRSHRVGESAGPESWRRPFETRNGALYGQVHDLEAHGLSIRKSLAALESDRDLNPWMAKKSVAELRIGHDDGWVKHTPEQGIGHYDWWTNPQGLIPRAVVILEGRAA